MNGTRVKCPNLIEHWNGSIWPCGCERFKVLEEKPFDRQSGLDPGMVLVECRECGLKFYVAPAIGKELEDEQEQTPAPVCRPFQDEAGSE